jgi:hypothetical protein
VLRLESPAVDGKSCASVCTRYRTDYRFRYCGIATRILQSAPTPASPVAPRGPWRLCAERQRESAGSWHAPSAFFRHKDKQTNNAAKERGGSGFSRPDTSEAMRAARAKRTDTRLSSPSVSACDTYSYTSRIYHLRGVQKIRTSRVDMHPSPIHVSRKVSNLLELSGKLIVLF